MINRLERLKQQYDRYWSDNSKYRIAQDDFTSIANTFNDMADKGYNRHELTRETLPIYFNETIGMTEDQKKQCEVRRNIFINNFEKAGFTVLEATYGSYYKLTIKWA